MASQRPVRPNGDPFARFRQPLQHPRPGFGRGTFFERPPPPLRPPPGIRPLPDVLPPPIVRPLRGPWERPPPRPQPQTGHFRPPRMAVPPGAARPERMPIRPSVMPQNQVSFAARPRLASPVEAKIASASQEQKPVQSDLDCDDVLTPELRHSVHLNLFSKMFMLNNTDGNKRSKISQAFADAFEETPTLNPYLALVVLVISEKGYLKANHSSFLFQLIIGFKDWLDKSGVRQSIKTHLTEVTQIIAFEKTYNVELMSIFQQIADIFELSRVKHFFKAKIDFLLGDQRHFRRGIEIIIALECQDDYTLQAVVIPLAISNACSLVEPFLKGSKRLQLETISWLDELTVQSSIGLEKSIEQNYPHITMPNLARLSGEPLGRFIKKLSGMFDVDLREFAPKFFQTKLVASFRHLVKEKTSHKMRLDNWRDLIFQQAQNEPHLHILLINYLWQGRITESNIEEAAYWAIRFQIDPTQLPRAVTEEVERIQSGTTDAKAETAKTVGEERRWDNDDWDEKTPTASAAAPATVAPATVTVEDWNDVEVSSYVPIEFLKLDVEETKIVFVDDQKKFRDFLVQIKKQYTVGIDCEFLSNAFMSKTTKAALIQLATKDEVYLIDAANIFAQLTDEDIKSFVQDLFVSGCHVVLGYSVNSDLKVLEKTHSIFDNLVERSRNVLDLEWFSKLMTTGSEKFINLPFTTTRKGLAGLSEMALGKPLDKLDQMSDWSKRPLTTEQLIYAALDAKVLVYIYDALQTIAEENDKCDQFAKIEKHLKSHQNKPPKQPKKKKPMQLSAAIDPNVVQAAYPGLPIEKHKLKVVCDSMLRGLHKKLEMEGVNTVVIEPFESIEACGKIGRSDRRMILTRGMLRYQKLETFAPPGMTLALKSDNMDEQLKEIWTHFKVPDISGEMPFCESCDNVKTVAIQRHNVIKVFNRLPKTASASVANAQDDFFDAFDEDEDDDDDIPYVNTTTNAGPEWIKDGEIEVDINSGKTKAGVKLRVENIPENILYKKDPFFACQNCGFVTWI